MKDDTLKKPKYILGLDPGLAIVGFGVIECPEVSTQLLTVAERRNQIVPTTSVKMLDFGIVQTTAKTPIGKRLVTIYEDLHTVFQEFKPDLVAVEQLFFYRMSSTIKVAQARGVLMLVLAQHDLPYLEFTPAQIKQALTGYGNADKLEVQEAVARELGLDKIPKPDDAADALAVAITAWFYLQ